MERMSPEERMVLRLIPVSDTRRINRVDISSITKLSERRVKKVIDTLVNRYGIVSSENVTAELDTIFQKQTRLVRTELNL